MLAGIPGLGHGAFAALTGPGSWVALGASGLVVGVLVGLTGAGGSSVLTPLLVLVFGLPAISAVGTDLAASLVMKPVGGLVHMHHRTVRMDIVRWLVVGSVPGAVLGVVILDFAGSSANTVLLPLLGAALLATAIAMLARPRLRARAARRSGESRVGREWGADGGGTGSINQKDGLRRVPTLLVGLFGGVLVGLTSVGSGSLMVVGMTMLYPGLTMAELIGTDLVAAVPMVGAAALGHLVSGDVHFGVAGALLVGAIPGTFLGARLSTRSNGRLARGALVAVLLATGIKLIGFV
ncbi:MAG: sulfite exporter TauE/SafE family protein [Acidimicrobiales bacterium]